ncbi:amidohydrolase family protein [Natrialbaceae archaeon AArc-T1-2]|uniref:amidohydrolase family protein n=1 Tax=Natrialbaceae archaeon AArc-T1-2 TaxID=3053904 RepID=UPI00255AC1B2|nr:amidohydrolase family protein [Natrialbaceae archaeon AArc-T1-2]WIV68735.1 amidohydrolase family protein [Natrialbaceae archaeon AArc-T1-2]
MSQNTSGKSVLEDTTIVDADVHLTRGISAEEMAEFLDEPYKSRVISEYCYPATSGSVWDPYMGEKIEERALDSPETIQQELVEDFGIDYPILNPMMAIRKIPNTETAIELMRARNDVMIDKFLDPSDFLGLCTVTTHDPHAAAEEIDRMANEDQIIGVFIINSANYPPLGDPKYDVVYEAAENHGMHVAYHGAAAGGFNIDFPRQNQEFEQFLSVHSLAHLWQSTMTLTSLIVQGVPEKFPDLNFNFLEAGLSWVPYMMWRLNKEYAMRRSEAPLLRKSPEEYIKDQFYFSSQPLGEPNNPGDMKEMIDLIGLDSVMFASDYPHWDFDHPDELDKHLRMFSKEEREQVLSETPAKAFGIDI